MLAVYNVVCVARVCNAAFLAPNVVAREGAHCCPKAGTYMSSKQHRAVVALLLAVVSVIGCARSEERGLTGSERDAIADTLRREIAAAYDLAKPGDAVVRLMSLYPATGTIVSASGGRVSVSRDSLEAGVRAFWDNVGKNMRDPTWTWGAMHVDVLARDAAVLTTTYRVPHLTPRGVPHVIAGAWTAVFQRRAGKWVIIQEHLSDVPQ